MATGTALLDLGDRYWALGLPAAARHALVRALAASDDATPAIRLAEIALSQADAAAARVHASEAARRAPGPATKILLGRAQLAAGELSAARMSMTSALDMPSLGGWDRARAHRELARAADAQGDARGASAHAATAFEAALGAARDVGNDALAVLEDICAAVVAHGRVDDAQTSLAGAPESLFVRFAEAALMVARHAAGDPDIGDRAIDAAFDAVGDDGGPAIQLRRLERRARKHATTDRAALTRDLEALIAVSTGDHLGVLDRARLWFLFASVCEEDVDGRARAEQAYRKGLALQPGHTAAACRLAVLMFDRGDRNGALAEIERALRIDASHGLAWRNAVRMLDAQSASLGAIVGRLLDAANPGAGSAAREVAPRLVTATAEVARHDVIAGVYAHGHRVKNLLGIIGARARSARKLAADPTGAATDLHTRLVDLEADVTSLYEEWALYLRSMQAPTPTVELVPLAGLVHEVVTAAQARVGQVAIKLDTAPGLPEVRGDRLLLREAFLNVVSNAAEACVPGGGAVAVRVRAVTPPGGAGAPFVEICVSDTGPGIPRAHLGRMFVPGFTTKETGSGVGLAIAERAVAAHHGRISVESEEGRGTSITITLPTDNSGLASLPTWTLAERTPQ